MPSLLPIINISTYKFTPLSDLPGLRLKLYQQCKDLKLKGSILLSPEGINAFVAGPRKPVESLIATLRKIPGLEDLEPKISESEDQPFTRMLVKIKKEIIAFGVDCIEPGKRTSPKLPAKELKKWLDEKRDILLLDTRNDYEIKLGTFKEAVPIGIQHFRDFPKAVESLPESLKEKPIVMFCTGGIRCEKAGPFMEQKGFKNIFQLEGGILKYFEECGGAHYKGGCFVFDQRVGLRPDLMESEDKQCFLCLSPLTPKDQKDPRYNLGVSCPYCFKSTEEQMQEVLEKRNNALKKVSSPLPGSQPYESYRPIRVPQSYDGFEVLHFLSEILPHTPKEVWLEMFRAKHFVNNERIPVALTHRVKAGERYLQLTPENREPDVNGNVRILYEDAALLVVNKPSPLPMHAGGRFARNTLQFLLNQVYAPAIPRASHRLDAGTTGIVVYARSKHFAGLIQPQFAEGKVQKTYLAHVKGQPKEDAFVCNLPISDVPINYGARLIAEDGLSARTEFKVLRRFDNGTSLLEARPITGRTNQIRVHLWALEYSIIGDPMYLENKKLGEWITPRIQDPPLRLHAYKIEFTHPVNRKRVEFKCNPDWLINEKWDVTGI